MLRVTIADSSSSTYVCVCVSVCVCVQVFVLTPEELKSRIQTASTQLQAHRTGQTDAGVVGCLCWYFTAYLLVCVMVKNAGRA